MTNSITQAIQYTVYILAVYPKHTPDQYQYYIHPGALCCIFLALFFISLYIFTFYMYISFSLFAVFWLFWVFGGASCNSSAQLLPCKISALPLQHPSPSATASGPLCHSIRCTCRLVSLAGCAALVSLSLY